MIPTPRWIVVRSPQIEGDWHYDRIIQELIGGREPVALLPIQIGPDQTPVCIYDRCPPAPPTAAATKHRGDAEVCRQ